MIATGDADRGSIALMVFLIAYAVFEVPSNYFLKKLKPSVCPLQPIAVRPLEFNSS